MSTLVTARTPALSLRMRIDDPASHQVGRHAGINAALARAWDGGWLRRPDLDPEALLRQAAAKTGGAPFGDPAGWRARLDLLAAALHEEAALTPLGQVVAQGQLVAALANRARMVALWQRHPEILDRPIVRPIIVLGQMRSGSTRMQRLLACDPRLSHTRFFESWNPVSSGRLGPIDDRWLRGWLGLRCASWLSPEFRTIHPTATGEADEEIGLHNISIFGAAFEAQWRIPRFTAAIEAMDARPIYAEFRRLLQTIAWLRRDRRDRPLILKLPQFAQDLPAVLDTFPDARLVCLSRDAAATVASSASLVHSQMRVQSDAVDRRWIGGECLRKVALRHHRSEGARRAADVPQVDVSFDAVSSDWRGEMERVYRMLDLPLTRAVAARMARYVARPQHRSLAGHRYTLADYGLSASMVAQAMRAQPATDEAPLQAA